jgi:hypothetical protein
MNKENIYFRVYIYITVVCKQSRQKKKREKNAAGCVITCRTNDDVMRPDQSVGPGESRDLSRQPYSKGPKKIKINKNKSNKRGGEGKWSKEAKEEEEERGNHNNNNHTVSLCAFLEFTSESRSVRIVSRSFPFFFFFYFDSLSPPPPPPTTPP